MFEKIKRRLTPVVLAWAVWGVVGLELAVDLLEPKAYQALIGAAATLSLIAVIRVGVVRIAAWLKVIVEHAETMAKHAVALDDAFRLGTLSDFVAESDAAALHRSMGRDADELETHRGRFR